MRTYGLILLASLPHASAAASDADVLKEFGFWGRLAWDCAAPPSGNNAQWIVSVSPEGTIISTTVAVGRITTEIRNPRLLAPDLIVQREELHGHHRQD